MGISYDRTCKRSCPSYLGKENVNHMFLCCQEKNKMDMEISM